MPTIEQPYLETLRYSQQTEGASLFARVFPCLFPFRATKQLLPRFRTNGLRFLDQIQHLMRYQDSQFVRHKRFRYAYFNLQLRKLSNSRTRQIVNNGNGGDNLSRDDIVVALAAGDATSEAIENRVVRTTIQIKGTRPFQSLRRRELSAYTQALGKVCLVFYLK